MNEIVNSVRFHDFDFYYISIGSGKTETHIPDLRFIKKSNCDYQLFPSFIRNDKKTLHIVIEPSFVQETKKVIQQVKKQFPNITSHFLQMSVPQTNLEESSFYQLFQQLVAIWNEKEIPKNKIVIINFIQFKLENEIEKSLLLSDQIYKSLKNQSESSSELDMSHQHNHYFHCLYVWFGYSPSLYNCFYKYKYYDNNTQSYKKFYNVYHVCHEVRSSNHFMKFFFIRVLYGKNILSIVRSQKNRERIERMLIVDKFYEENLKLIQKDKIDDNEYVLFFLKNTFCLLSPTFENFYKQLQ